MLDFERVVFPHNQELILLLSVLIRVHPWLLESAA